LYVTLEPCCHEGKTPPCSRAVAEAGIGRLVVAQRDPFPQVAGGGIAELGEAGIDIELGLLEHEARQLNAPYLKLLETGRPWIIAKWAMTLDGKTATRTGSSQWISCDQSRRTVHQLRGRVDAIMVGSRTARLDDPLLTARPPGPRTALRVVMDTRASLSPESQLVRTAREVPVLVAVGPEAPDDDRRRLEDAGCEVLRCQAPDRSDRLNELLDELGRRRATNVLIEGGGSLTGSLMDSGQIDEFHVFIAPKLVGGAEAPGPISGTGLEAMADALALGQLEFQQSGNDIYLQGRLARSC
jgi:diaminohydroxyphosphoribosylaminopyrimidine deaminase/5-amino-6-(5-phosphoribosylamino)uracil reductase